MQTTVVTGGARSGKSGFAQQLAAALGGDRVTVIATAQETDDDMRERIARHRADRPAGWEILEAAVNIGEAMVRAQHEVVLLDCLTVLSANAMIMSKARTSDAAEAAVMSEIRSLVNVSVGRAGALIVVTNEVGSAVHPATDLGRWFQDALGRGNALIASHADNAILMVCGIPLILKGTAWWVGSRS